MKASKKIRKLKNKLSKRETKHMLEMSDLKIALGSNDYRARFAEAKLEMLKQENELLRFQLDEVKFPEAIKVEDYGLVQCAPLVAIVGDENNAALNKNVN